MPAKKTQPAEGNIQEGGDNTQGGLFLGEGLHFKEREAEMVKKAEGRKGQSQVGVTKTAG